MTDADQNRQSDRRAVLKTAKLVFGDSVVDCLVVDLSENGVRVRLSTVVPIPEQATVQFPGGTSYDAVRRWARGTEIGLEFTGGPQLGTSGRAHAWELYESIRDRGLDLPLRQLRDMRCFDDPELSRIADQAEAGLRELEGALRRRGRG